MNDDRQWDDDIVILEQQKMEGNQTHKHTEWRRESGPVDIKAGIK